MLVGRLLKIETEKWMGKEVGSRKEFERQNYQGIHRKWEIISSSNVAYRYIQTPTVLEKEWDDSAEASYGTTQKSKELKFIAGAGGWSVFPVWQLQRDIKRSHKTLSVTLWGKCKAFLLAWKSQV